MTPNNEVKAPRPCTLPKEWKGERTFNIYNFTEIEYIYERSDYWTPDCDVCGSIRINVYIKTNASIDPFRHTQWYDKEKDAIKEAQLFSMEVIRAIASAQRQWLKAKWFQFVDGEEYEILSKAYEKHIDTVYNATASDYILAFKPISDSQEAWDAVAHVEVWEG